MASPAPSSPSDPGASSSELKYLLAAVAAVAFLLLLYNAIAVGWCSQHCPVWGTWRLLSYRREAAVQRRSSQVTRMIPVCEYREEGAQEREECSVCLSAFVEGEVVRRLPKCEHLFHAPCIDMWLCSHASCPLCRASVMGMGAPQPSSVPAADVEDPARLHPPVVGGPSPNPAFIGALV